MCLFRDTTAHLIQQPTIINLASSHFIVCACVGILSCISIPNLYTISLLFDERLSLFDILAAYAALSSSMTSLHRLLLQIDRLLLRQILFVSRHTFEIVCGDGCNISFSSVTFLYSMLSVCHHARVHWREDRDLLAGGNIIYSNHIISQHTPCDLLLWAFSKL